MVLGSQAEAASFILDNLGQLLPGSRDLLAEAIAVAFRNRDAVGFLAVGSLVLLLFSASNAFIALDKAVNRAWDTEKLPSFTGGYECQINSTHRDPIKTGSIYTRVHVYEDLVPPDTWFTQEVEVVDRDFRGQTVTSITVKVDVEVERWSSTGDRVKVTEAEVVLVALDEKGQPRPIRAE